MQLRGRRFWTALALLGAAVGFGSGLGGLAAPARAGVSADSRVTYFMENSTANAGIQVVHPQAQVAADLGSAVRLSLGYELDVVTGATPSVFGEVDAVTGATSFSDERHAVSGGLRFTFGDVTVTGGYFQGWESDYRSHAVSAGAEASFLDRNFTVGLAYTHNFDQVCAANNRGAQGPLDLKPLPTSDHCFDASRPDVVTRNLAIDTFEPTLTWTATPRLLLQAGGTLQILNGFQSNPYRRVLVGHSRPQENHPDHRQRYAVFGRAFYALPALKASASLMVRGYRDTWSVEAGTAELGLNKYLGPSMLLQARGRYHRQTGALFYRNALDLQLQGPTGTYWTGDRELAPMTTVLGGAKVAYINRAGRERRFMEGIELSVKVDYLLYFLDSDFAPNADRNFALIGQAGLSLFF